MPNLERCQSELFKFVDSQNSKCGWVVATLDAPPKRYFFQKGIEPTREQARRSATFAAVFYEMSASPDVCMIIDDEGDVVANNYAYKTFFGEEVEGLKISRFLPEVEWLDILEALSFRGEKESEHREELEIVNPYTLRRLRMYGKFKMVRYHEERHFVLLYLKQA